MGNGSFPGVEVAGAWDLTHPHLVSNVLEKSTAIPLINLRVCVACKKGEKLLIYEPINVGISVTIYGKKVFPLQARCGPEGG